jgi:protein tyrosine phosphatase
VFPDDYNRVVLEHSVEYGDYINASYVDVSVFIMVVMGMFLKLVKKSVSMDTMMLQSLLRPNAYIVSQGPIENTVGDFWRMVWQKNVSCIIMLTKTFDFIKVTSL